MSRTSYPAPALRNVGECYCCPMCHRVSQGLFDVSYCQGLVAIDGALMCAACLGALREQERPGEIWDVRIRSMRGAPLAPRWFVLA